MPRHTVRPQDAQIMRRIIDEAYGGSTVVASVALKTHSSSISRILSGKYALAPRLDNIRAALPFINEEFLKTGEGDPGCLSVQQTMRRYEKILEGRDEVIARLSKEIETQRRVIEMLIDAKK